MPEVKLEDVALNNCNESNGTTRYAIQDAEDSLPLTPSAADLEVERILRKDETTSENASTQDEVDEEDLQEDELEELEEEEEEEDEDDEEADVEEEGTDTLEKKVSLEEHPGLICRLCAQPVDTAHFIFSEEGKGDKLPDKINSTLPISVSKLCPDTVNVFQAVQI